MSPLDKAQSALSSLGAGSGIQMGHARLFFWVNNNYNGTRAAVR